MKTFYVESFGWLFFIWGIIMFILGLTLSNNGAEVAFFMIISVHLFFVWGVLLAYADKRREE